MIRKILLLSMILLTLCSAALAFDWEPWILQGDYSRCYQIEQLDPHNTVALAQTRDEWVIFWWTDGAVAGAYPAGRGHWSDHFIFQGNDGTCGFLKLISNDDGSQVYIQYHWTSPQEEPVPVARYEWTLKGMIRCKGYVVLTEEHDGRCYTHIINMKGQESAVLETTGASLYSIVAIREGEWWADLVMEKQHHMFHIRDQRVVSSTPVPQEDYAYYPKLYPCGDMLFRVCIGAKQGAYHDLSIIAISDESILWQKTMSASRVLLYIDQVTESDTGGYVLLGEAVANSRQIYDAFRLQVDEAWNITSVDMRTCDYLQSYSYVFDSRYPYSSDMIIVSPPTSPKDHIPYVLVPFDVLLSAGTDHSIRIK